MKNSGANKAKDSIISRKDQHLDLALASPRAEISPFDCYRFEHCALPELDLASVDLSTNFLGHTLRAPLLISAMTGGPEKAARINRHLAEAAQELGIALAVGSQRVALEEEQAHGIDGVVRNAAPDILLFANLGAAQLNLGYSLDHARRAVEMIGANALIVHLNPLQEALQSEGDTDWSGLVEKIGELAGRLDVPVIAKEIGCGISANVARQLQAAGIAGVDIAGCGGTSWAMIEAKRARSEVERRVAECFSDWGIPTPQSLLSVRHACPEIPLIASGGIRHGVDAAKALRLGADLVGQAAGVLPAAMDSTQAVIDHFRIIVRQLKVAMFCTGSATLSDLKTAALHTIAGESVP